MNLLEPIFPGKEFREFWNSTHPHALSDFQFDPSKPYHYAWEKRGESGEIVAALILVPFVKENVILCHHVHLCATIHSKALFQFCADVMILANLLPDVGYILCETQGKPEYRRAERIAKTMGFEPIFLTDHEWTDFVWNSKAA